MRNVLLAVSLLSLTAGAHASLQSLVKAAKDGQSVEAVMKQANAESAPVDTLLADLIKAGVIRGENIADAVAAAVKATPARAGAVVTVALSSFPTHAQGILKAAFSNAPAQASQIAASAKAAGVDEKVVTAAQTAALASTGKNPTGAGTTTSSSNISVSPFTSPNSGGGGGGGLEASPN